MPSTFTWLDYSEHERRQAQQVIALFEEKGTVDELGIGSIRDAISDILFPGTSVLQSRARYLFFVPWMYLDLERRRVPAVEFGPKAARAERKFISVLLEGEDTAGVVGKVAGEAVKLLPSSIYWQGLGRWGIRTFPGSQRQYHRSVDRFYKLAGAMHRTDDDDPIFGRVPRNWHAGIPAAPADFPDSAALALTRPEAEYLRDRVAQVAAKTVLSYLLSDGTPGDPVDFAWNHHQFGDFPVLNRFELEQARNFSDVMNGAALLYNLLLARAKASEDLVAEYEQALRDWDEHVGLRESALASWRRDDFWALLTTRTAGIRPGARAFVTSWLDMAIGGDRKALPDNPAAQRLIRERERALKRGLARLDNRRALDAWLGASGVRPLDYRWGVVQGIVRDIQLGLEQRAAQRA